MHIRIRTEGGAEFQSIIIPPPLSLSLSNPTTQSSLLGKRIEVAIGDDGWDKALHGTVVRADEAADGMALAFLDDGTVMKWGEGGVWGIRRAPKLEPYRDPNWQSAPFPNAPISYGCVVPAFPSSPVPKPNTSWHLSFVEEDAIVEAARVAADQTAHDCSLQLRWNTEKTIDPNTTTIPFPWMFLPLSGSYDEKVGAWAGWVENAERTWIAFIGRDGFGLVWEERDADGGVRGNPTTFLRDVATYPLFLIPRQRGSVKKIRSHRGLEIHIDRPMGTIIEGVDPEGKKYVFEHKCDYGFFPNTLGDDGDEFDVYVGHNPLSNTVFIIEQLRARSGHWDERKAIVGCDSMDEALNLYSAHVHPRMVGRIGTMTHAEFEQTLRDHQSEYAATKKSARKPMIPVTHEDAAELGEMEALRAELEEEWKREGGEKAADETTDFPAKGDNKTVALRNSKFARFDVDWALDLKKKHPKVWDLGGNIRGNKQFTVLSRIQKQGGTPHTAAEEAAVRLREPWAARHFEDFRPPGVVAQIKWLVVGKLGEQKMKRLINKEKERQNKMASTDERSPISFIPPSDDFNPDSEPTSVPPISSEPPSSVQSSLAANKPSAVDPTMVIDPMPPTVNNTNDVGPLSQRAPTPNPLPQTMPNAMHTQIHRIILGTLALSAAGAIQLSTEDRDSFRQYIARDGSDASGVSQHKDADTSRLQGRTGPSTSGVMQRRVVELSAKADSIANIDVENREITFIASTPSVDSHGEVVAQDWKFERFEKNPVILWAHNQREPPIGRAVKWWVEQGKTLYIRVKFSQVYAFAQLIFDMIVEGTIRACSVGFIPYEITREEVDGQLRTVLRRNELCELSVCPVPSNADAVIPKEIELATERCAKAIEQRLAAIATENKQAPPPRNVGAVASGTTSRGAPPAAQATTDHKSGRGRIMNDIHVKEQVRRDGAIAHTCGKCGDESHIQVPAVRERMIELETRASQADAERSTMARREEEANEKRKLAEQAHNELQKRFTTLELAPLTGPDLWNISPARVRELAELRQRSGEDAYREQLAATQEACAKIKGMAEENAKLKNAPAVPPTVLPGQTSVSALGQALATQQAQAPVEKTADPMHGWLNS